MRHRGGSHWGGIPRSRGAAVEIRVVSAVAIAYGATYSDRMTQRAAPHQVSFSIAQLEAWAPGVTGADEWREWALGQRAIEKLGEPALQQMPAMLRRHAGRLGRLACSPAYDSLGELRDVPMVFSARYGEVSRSVELLTALSAAEELSPTTFGLSVHNAVPGLFSMARKETANSISLAAGEDSAEAGVIEACGLLDDGAEQVLLVVADCPLPGIYENFADTQPVAFGWSCLIRRPSVHIVTLEWRDVAGTSDVSSNLLPGGLAVLPLLMGHSSVFERHSAIGQKVTSDPEVAFDRPAFIRQSEFGQNVTSDPEVPFGRTWRWTRNA